MLITSAPHLTAPTGPHTLARLLFRSHKPLQKQECYLMSLPGTTAHWTFKMHWQTLSPKSTALRHLDMLCGIMLTTHTYHSLVYLYIIKSNSLSAMDLRNPG